jgi:hypothetical protein
VKRHVDETYGEAAEEQGKGSKVQGQNSTGLSEEQLWSTVFLLSLPVANRLCYSTEYL